MRARNVSLLMLFLLCFLGAAVIATADPICVTWSSGLTSTVSGADTVTFTTTSSLPAGFTANCTSSVDCGVFPSTTMTADAHNPTGNTSPFIAPGAHGQWISIDLAATQMGLAVPTPLNYFGLYWGSVDSYNDLSFYDGSKLVDSFTGADLLALDPSLTAGSSSTFVNFAFNGNTVTNIVFTSINENFESVNEAFAETPEPATLALMGIGLFGLALLARPRDHELP